MKTRPFTALLLLLAGAARAAKYQWTYEDVFGGPDFWGLLNKEWQMCSNGRHQSPINVDPSALLFDPRLRPLHISTAEVKVPAVLENAGQLPVLTLGDGKTTARNGRNVPVNITGGPLAGYHYNLYQIIFHFGNKRNYQGSEHTIDGERFPGEIQFLGYNADLHRNFTEAATKPRGLVGISVMVDIGHGTNSELKRISAHTMHIVYKGSKTVLDKVTPYELLSPTPHYVTYEGSLTYPGCYETVTWIVMNKPIYITKTDFARWNDLQQSETKQATPSYMTPNFRPLKDLNHRLLRTNINFKTKTNSACPTMYKDMYYRANPNRIKSNRLGSDLGKRAAENSIVIDDDGNE